MRAPERKTTEGGLIRWVAPDKEWLEDQYLTQGKSQKCISLEIGANVGTIRGWMITVSIPIRGPDTCILGKRHPRWKVEGEARDCTYQGRARRALRRIERPRRCEWCDSHQDLHVHHKDHNKTHNAPENLQYLCKWCHRLETALWHLRKEGKISLRTQEKTIVVSFY